TATLRSNGEIASLTKPMIIAEVKSDQGEPTLQQVGRYKIEKLIGTGGMGDVYQAFDPVLNRSIALKFIRGDDPKQIERLIQEGRAQASIEHPNICKVYEVSQDKNQFFIAMQYIKGKTLKEVSEELTLEQKIKVIAQAAEGLQAAHKAGLIHRDIKPQ